MRSLVVETLCPTNLKLSYEIDPLIVKISDIDIPSFPLKVPAGNDDTMESHPHMTGNIVSFIS